MPDFACMVILGFVFKTPVAMKKRKPQRCCRDSPLDRDLKPQIQTVHEDFTSYRVYQEIYANVAILYSVTAGAYLIKEKKKNNQSSNSWL